MNSNQTNLVDLKLQKMVNKVREVLNICVSGTFLIELSLVDHAFNLVRDSQAIVQ